MEPKNIDKKLEKELEILKPLKEASLLKEINDEINKAWKASKYNGRTKSKIFMDKLKVELEKSNYKSAPRLKELFDTLGKIKNNSTYLKFPFSKQTEDFALAHVRLMYNNSKTVEPLSKHYNDIIRTNMKSVSVISESGSVLFTLDIVNNKLLYRRRNLPPSIADQNKLAKLSHSNYERMDWNNPKRCFILGTEGRTVFVWDSGETVEITKWSEIRPYDKPNLREEEIF